MIISKTAAAAMLLLALLLSGCGRKGPLYMSVPAAPAPAASVPAVQQQTNSALPVQSQPVPTQTESQKQP